MPEKDQYSFLKLITKLVMVGKNTVFGKIMKKKRIFDEPSMPIYVWMYRNLRRQEMLIIKKITTEHRCVIDIKRKCRIIRESFSEN